MEPYMDEIVPKLLCALSEPSEEVVINAVQAMASVCTHEGKDSPRFKQCIAHLINMFEKDALLMERKGIFIIR